MDRRLSIYIPMDRRHALANNRSLPERTEGSALFADISGFTALTEALTRTLGAHHGAEELTRQLNQVYDALIAEVDRFGGSMIDFSGDSITSWFDGDQDVTALRSVACTLAMQQAMQAFKSVDVPGSETVSLSMKATVASGPASRFVLGDPTIQQIDVIAGKTLDRVAAAEHLAKRGEVLVDLPTAVRLGKNLDILAWRAAEGTEDIDVTSERFAVVGALRVPVEPAPWPALAEGALTDEQMRPWLLPAVYERMQDGLGEFLTELRPTVSIFLSFTGIDYDGDPQAGSKLNAYICWAQNVLTRYEGVLIDLTFGDKGSYLYGSFGAPVAHEDDAHRAASAALELRTPPTEFGYIGPVQIGISRGTMRTGAFGGTTRRTYGILGNDVNLAARLMQHAAPGEVLVSGHIQPALTEAFVLEALPPIRVKGQSEPISVAKLVSRLEDVEAGVHSGPMIGRDAEIAQLKAFIGPILNGQFAGLAYIYGEPGMGKTRLIYELRQQLANEHALSWFACPAEQIVRQSLHPFKYFLSRHFKQDSAFSEAENTSRFDTAFSAILENLGDEAELRRDLDRRKSFLGAMVNLHWVGSPFEQLEPKLRFENMLEAFITLIVAESKHQPVVLHIEDAQWLDADSQALLKFLVRGALHVPLAVLITSRYSDDGGKFTLDVEPSVPQHSIDLNQLSIEGIRAMAAYSLAGEVAEDLVGFLMQQAEGNPFFTEQMALDLRERGLLRQESGAWHIDLRELDELPAGINAVLIARLDRLAAQVKAVVQMAAVLGHEFEVRILSQMLRDDEHLPTKVKQAETMVIWSALSDVRYLFRHALLRDAAYEMQLQERLRQLHALAGAAMELVYADALPLHAAALAYHFRKAEDREREGRFARLAGEHAAAHFANAEAIAYLSRALDLDPDDEERYLLLLAREQVYDRLGARQAQSQDLAALIDLAERLRDQQRRAETLLRRASYLFVTGDYPAAIESAHQAIALSHEIQADEFTAAGYLQWGRALLRQSDYVGACEQLERALTISRQAGLTALEGDSLRHLGIAAYDEDDYATAWNYLGQALKLSRAAGDLVGEGGALNNLGMVTWYRGEPALAQEYFEQALHIRREVGDRRGEGAVLNNLGSVAHDQGHFAEARAYLEQSLRLSHEIGDRLGESIALDTLGSVTHDQGDYTAARDYLERSLHLSHEIGDRRDQGIALDGLGSVLDDEGDYNAARDYLEQSLRLSNDIGDRRDEGKALASLGLVLHHLGNDDEAETYCRKALKIAQDTGDRFDEATALTFLGHAQVGLKKYDEAEAAYRKALALRRVLSEPHLGQEPLAGLARLALLRGDLGQALAQVNEILDFLEIGSLEGTHEPTLVYLTCYRIYQAAKDPRAETVLKTAYTDLQVRAAKIQDEDLRRSMLENVSAHRELMTAWAEVQAKEC